MDTIKPILNYSFAEISVADILILLGGHVTASCVDRNLDLEAGAWVDVANLEFGVEHLETAEHLADVTSLKYILARNLDDCLLAVGIVDDAFEAHLLQVEDDVGDVFLNAWDGCELMLHAVDTDVADGISLKSAEQYAAQGVTHGDAVAGLQGAELEFSESVVGLQH